MFDWLLAQLVAPPLQNSPIRLPGPDAGEQRPAPQGEQQPVPVEIQEPIIRNPEPALRTVYESNSALQLGEAVQVDWAAEGADVTILRVIRDGSGNELRRDSIFTHYIIIHKS